MKFLAVIVVITFVLSGCRKSDRDQDTSILASKDQTTLDMMLSTVLSIVDEAARKQYGLISSYGTDYLSCAVVSPNLGSTPQTIVIDFGPYCNGPDDRLYYGKIHMSMNGNYFDSTTVTTISFIDYVVDYKEIRGKVTLTNKGRNTAGKLNFDVSYTDLKIVRETDPAWNASYSGSINRSLVSGNATPQVTDDIYHVTGKGSGRSRSGNLFSYVITDSLRIDNTCKYFVTAGSMELTPENLVTRHIDYGTNTCDGEIVVTFNDVKHKVTLP